MPCASEYSKIDPPKYSYVSTDSSRFGVAVIPSCVAGAK
jgi:hypothetical protein